MIVSMIVSVQHIHFVWTGNDTYIIYIIYTFEEDKDGCLV